MNARLALLCCLLGAPGCAALQPPTLAQKQDAINAALASAYVACKVALDDPRMEFEPGARAYCLRILAAPDECGVAK